ncbi:MAG TPA: hypothetical protein VL485_17550 [Ktedonobacteraceae bacterium]|jgi:hypothetical protein|nr:hypothetical protein [Ktedonobacteraceae bacterium]
MGTYTEPVNQLLHFRELESSFDIEKIDYVTKFGLSRADIPELIRLASDEDFLQEDAESIEAAAPIYALEALTQLHAEEAIEPLLTPLKNHAKDEWVIAALIRFYTTFAARSIPTIRPILFDSTITDPFAKGLAGDIITSIAEQHPETRSECIEVFIAVLNAEPADPELNGEIVQDLITLHAVEAVPTVEKAFQADKVDLVFGSTWEDFQVDMGLKEPDETKKSFFQDLDFSSAPSSLEEKPQHPAPNPYLARKPSTPQAGKNKAKQAKAARKKNRRKK